ncbi:MAG: hypothetical protein ACJ746_25975 [Bryobacteraceae bacterium]
MQSGIFGLVDDTHAATAKLLENPVVADRLAGHSHNSMAYFETESNLNKLAAYEN